ncbi:MULTISPECIES: ferredoxin [unclassified Mycobacteroides]|uniref:ferredoxin n=1 Tax=unclassified Mycobacteroides TaxID=2618759 RepID=UPI001396A050|nr:MULTISPECIES: (4Fe-4S)-binding protein [unclassified Mycobacteroides]
MTESSMQVNVDKDICFGSGFCARMTPAVFGIDEQGVVELVGAASDDVTKVPAESAELVRETEIACPSGAITTSEADAG